MAANESPGASQQPTYPATVVHVLSPYRVVINRGSEQNIRVGQRFLIYRLGDADIVDPGSGESLGKLEIVRGIGRVTHVQDKMATLESDRKSPAQRTVVRKRNPSRWFSEEEEEERFSPPQETLPFDDPSIGDSAKPV